jgi:hypothetical protein
MHAIQETAGKLAGRRVKRGHITLMRLEEKGYVSPWLGEPTPERGGKPKRRKASGKHQKWKFFRVPLETSTSCLPRSAFRFVPT